MTVELSAVSVLHSRCPGGRDVPPNTARHLSEAAGVPLPATRWLLDLADLLAAALNLSRQAAMLELAAAYQRVAEAGEQSAVIRDAMQTGASRARRLAEHLAVTSPAEQGATSHGR